MDAESIAAKCEVSRAWVHRLMQRRRETGSLAPRKQTTVRRRTLAPHEERVHATRPGMKVIYMSGYTDGVVMRHGVSAEGTPFLTKPFTAVELTRKVREVLDSER